MTCSQMLSIKTIILINSEMNLNTDSVWKMMNTIILKPSLKSVTRKNNTLHDTLPDTLQKIL